MKKIKTLFDRKTRLLAKYQWFLFFIGIGWTIINLVFSPSTNSLALLKVMVYWIILGLYYRINEKFFFVLAIICLILTVPPLLLGNLMWAERFSVWEFLFIAIALWQWLYLELRDKINKR